MRFPKSPPPVRSEKYKRFVRSKPCCVCGQTNTIETAHFGPRGLGQKVSDRDVIPLCQRDHRTGVFALHKIGPGLFQRRYGIDALAIIRALNEEYDRKQAAA